jgi:hypothetical protein
MTVMLRVSEQTRDRVQRLISEEFPGDSADAVLSRLLDEHWERAAVAAMDRFRAEDPAGYTEYLGEMAEWEALDAPVPDPWAEGR